MMRRASTGVVFLLAAVSCSSSENQDLAPAVSERDTAPELQAEILSAYYGLDALPAAILLLCPGSGAPGADGMPVTFDVRLQAETVSPDAFVVETAGGQRVTPECATLRPADEPLENRTVLLAGTFGTPDAQPRAVEVVGPLTDVDGYSLLGVRSDRITALELGPSLLIAERYAPDKPGLAGECPEETRQVVQLVWEGGVTGPDGAELGEAQRQAVTVQLADGSVVQPIALADDDPDNFVHACLDTDVEAEAVTVAAGFFHDPGDDANPDTHIDVVEGHP